MIACTVVARNYLAAAQVLTESFLESHPTGKVEVLLLDDLGRETGNGGRSFSTIFPEELGLDPAVLRAMRAMYSVTEFATALKPALLRTLLQRHDQPVTYLDPDIQVFGSLQDCDDLAKEHAIVLTPHTVRPMPRDGLYPSEADILSAGGFNLGFITVGTSAIDFLDWWGHRLETDCIVDVSRGLFVDQRWLDLAVHYFPHFVHRDETLNVAYWNLDSRPLETNADGYAVHGRPLRFFHFSGFDPEVGSPSIRYSTGSSRLATLGSPALERIYGEYSNLLFSAGHREWSTLPYGYAVSVGGISMTRRLRRAYRQRVLEDPTNPPPDPFDESDIAAFREWARPDFGNRIVARLPPRLRATLRQGRRAWRAGGAE